MVFSCSMVFCIALRYCAARIRFFMRQGRSWYSAAAWYSALICDGVQHESGYLRESADHGIQLHSALGGEDVQHESGYLGDSADHGVQLQYGILH